jgi:hypothetical protein
MKLTNIINAMHVEFFSKCHWGVNENNAQLLSIVHRYSPLLSYLNAHRAAFENEEQPEKMNTHDGCTTNSILKINYEEYFDVIHNEFPCCPFEVALSYSSLSRLDEPFDKNDPDMIVIRDTRVLRDTFGFYRTVKHDPDVSDCEMDIYKHSDDSPITLRQIIGEMSLSDHYDNVYVIQDDHRFLEGFEALGTDEYDSPVYSPSFGS